MNRGGTSTCTNGYTCANDTVNGIITINNMTGSYNSDTIYLNISNVIPVVSSPSLTVMLKLSNYAVLTSTQIIAPSLPDIITYSITQTSYILESTTDIIISYTLTYLNIANISSTLSRISYILVYIPV